MSILESSGMEHEHQWTTASIRRFWDYRANRGDAYFSEQVGRGIVFLLQRVGALHGRVLDYGCGPGHLLWHLLRAGVTCEGVDTSAESIEIAEKRFVGNPRWSGAHLIAEGVLPHEPGSLDTILCVETIEHLLPNDVGPLLLELRRVLRAGTGMLFVTVPSSEVLRDSYVLCPECGSVFHRNQHLRSLDRHSLTALMADHGFSTILCDQTEFERFQIPQFPGLRDWSYNATKKLLRTAVMLAADWLRPQAAPLGGSLFQSMIGGGRHLFWLGRVA